MEMIHGNVISMAKYERDSQFSMTAAYIEQINISDQLFRG